MRTLALLLFLAANSWAACASLGGGRWSCYDTGDEYTNGTDLFNLFNNKSFSCGDTIILTGGATYTGPATAQGAFPLKPQTGCTEGKMTTLTHTRISELQEGKRVSPSDKAKMPILRTRTSYPIFELRGETGGGGNNYLIQGVALSTHDTNVTNNTVANILVLHHGFSDIERYYYISKKIHFDRVLVYPREEELYGDANISNTEGRALLRTASTAFSRLWINDFQLTNSYIYGLGGYQKGTEISYTSISNANPAVLTSTGIAAALNITPSALSDSRCSSISGCNANCYEALGCARMVAVDGAGNWLDLNGKVWARVIDANSVQLHKDNPNLAWYISASGTTAYDSSAKGTPTAAIKFYPATLLTQYGYYSAAGHNNKIINNHIETWAMNIFLGGADPSATHTGVVQSGSTSTSIILDNVKDLEVGMLITVPASGVSSWCSSGGCTNGGLRIGRVTAINGTTVTVTPQGPDGIDTTPTTSGVAKWKGPRLEGLLVVGNNLYKSSTHPLDDAGKGPIEIKTCERCLFSGNYIGPSGGNYFVTVRNQGGNAPWATAKDVTFQHNVASGAPLRLSAFLADTEHTVTLGKRLIYEHNIHPNATDVGAGTVGYTDGNGLDSSSGWRHNTLTAAMAHPGIKLFTAADCTPSGYAYGDNTGFILKDNIIPYGQGVSNGSSCTAIAGNITSNLVVDTSSVGTSAINTAIPSNTPIANYSGLFSGTCDGTGTNWENCTLSAATYKGAASDGGDLGADIPAIKDRINRWSFHAGLMTDSLSEGNVGVIPNPGAIKTGSTRAILTFNRFGGSAGTCTLKLYTALSRVSANLHADTDTGGEQACSRTGNITSNDQVTFVLGTNTALTANTTYHYEITDGARVMIGWFKTQVAKGAGTYNHTFSGTSRALTYSSNADLSSGTTLSATTSHTVPVSNNSVIYYRHGTAANGDPIKALVEP